MNQTILNILFFLISATSVAQVTEAEPKIRNANKDTVDGWKRGGNINIGLSQSSFSNWSAGGQNSISVNGLFSGFANLKKGKSSWDNMLDLGYGVLKQENNAQFIKTDDKIDISSKFGQFASHNWYYAAFLNFKSQMTKGYNYPNDSVKISDFLAPAYILGALGMDFKPTSSFTGFVAPLTSKVTIVNDSRLADQGAYGVTAASYDASGNMIKHGIMSRNEFGGYLRIVYKQSFFKDKSVSLLSKFDVFSNYIKNPQNIDINCETILNFKVNKYISATITAQIIYDDDVKIAIKDKAGNTTANGPRVQIKEVIGIGFSYKFVN